MCHNVSQKSLKRVWLEVKLPDTYVALKIIKLGEFRKNITEINSLKFKLFPEKCYHWVYNAENKQK